MHIHGIQRTFTPSLQQDAHRRNFLSVPAKQNDLVNISDIGRRLNENLQKSSRLEKAELTGSFPLRA